MASFESPLPRQDLKSWVFLQKLDPKSCIPAPLTWFPCLSVASPQVQEHVSVWDQRPREPAVPQWGKRQQELHTSCAKLLFFHPTCCHPCSPSHPLPRAPIQPLARPPVASPLLILNLFSLLRVALTASDHTQWVTCGAKTPWLDHPLHGHITGYNGMPPCVPSPRDPPRSWDPAVPEPTAPGLAAATSKLPAVPRRAGLAPHRLLCSSVSLALWLADDENLWPHESGSPRASWGLQATWEAAGSTAPAGMQQPSQ